MTLLKPLTYPCQPIKGEGIKTAPHSTSPHGYAKVSL